MDINGFLMLNGRGAGPSTEDLAIRFLARAVTEYSQYFAWGVFFSSGYTNGNIQVQRERRTGSGRIWRRSKNRLAGSLPRLL